MKKNLFIKNLTNRLFTDNYIIVVIGLFIFSILIFSIFLDIQLKNYSYPKIDALEDSYTDLSFGIKQVEISENKTAYFDHMHLLDSLITNTTNNINSSLQDKNFHDYLFPTFSTKHINVLNTLKVQLKNVIDIKDSLIVYSEEKVLALIPVLKTLKSLDSDLENRFTFQTKILKSVQLGLVILFLTFFGIVLFSLKNKIKEKSNLIDIQHELIDEIKEKNVVLKQSHTLAKMGYYTLDFNKQFIEPSDTLFDILGIKEKKIDYNKIFEIISGKNRTLIFEQFKKMRALNKGIDLTYKIINQDDGSEKWIHHVSIPYQKNDKGEALPVIGIMQDITEKHNLERKYLHSSIEAQEAEKQSFGEALHDGISQILSAQSMYIDILMDLNKDKDGEIIDYLEKIKTFNSDAITDARNIAHGLMSKQLYSLGFVNAIDKICLDYNISKKMNFTFFNKGVKDSDLSELAQLNLYRIVQEITTNIMRHSMATEAGITLKKSKSNGGIELTIKDNGIGMDLEKIKIKKTGAGLQNIERRVKLLFGKINLITSPNNGICYTIKVPLLRQI